MLTRILKIWVVVALLLLLAMSAVLAGSPRDMNFDGVTIMLGQPTDQALSRLHGTFDLQPVAGQSGSYRVQTKGKTSILLGTVSFQNGQVVRLERERGVFSDIGQGKTMTTLMNELIKEDNTHAVISVEKQLRDGVSLDIITLKFPGKRLIITVSNPPTGSGQVWIREIFE